MRPVGLSAFLRCRNEEEYIVASVLSVYRVVDEIVVVFNNSSDRSRELVEELACDYPKIKIFDYPHECSPIGAGYREAVTSAPDSSLARYYNWCLEQTSLSHVCKWDGDMIATPVFEDVRRYIPNSEVITFDGYDLLGQETTSQEPRIFRYDPNRARYKDWQLYEVLEHDYSHVVAIRQKCYLHMKLGKREWRHRSWSSPNLLATEPHPAAGGPGTKRGYVGRGTTRVWQIAASTVAFALQGTTGLRFRRVVCPPALGMSRRTVSRAVRTLGSVSLFEKYRSYTMAPRKWFRRNLLIVNEHRHVPGCVIECGVWRGGMAAAIAEVLGSDRQYFLFDSFEGLPEATPPDGEAARAWQQNTQGPTFYENCHASIEFARAAMEMSGANRYTLVKGWFQDTLPGFLPPCPIAVLRLDGDWYESTLIALESLFKHMAPGGIVIVDDYYAWDGCSRAVHDFLSRDQSAARLTQRYGICVIEQRP